MLVFNCTKNAAIFFTATKNGKKSSPIQPATYKTIDESLNCQFNDTQQWNWLVHVIKVKRKNVLIIMDYHSRYSITLTGLKKGDWVAFLNKFEHHLNVNVHEVMSLSPSTTDLIDESLDSYYQQHQSTLFHKRGDRSMQGHINDVAWHFEISADEMGYVPQDVELIGFDQHINHMLRKHKEAKDYFYPQHEFLRHWLNQYAQLTKIQADQHISNLMAQERAKFQDRFKLMETTEISSTKQLDDLDNVIYLENFRKKID